MEGNSELDTKNESPTEASEGFLKKWKGRVEQYTESRSLRTLSVFSGLSAVGLYAAIERFSEGRYVEAIVSGAASAGSAYAGSKWSKKEPEVT